MLLASLFIIGYTMLIFDYKLKINKAAIALAMGTILWVAYFEFGTETTGEKYSQLLNHLSGITQVFLFLIGAMTIVELIAEHQGFLPLKHLLITSSPKQLFWILSFISFWMSSILDNLTTILVLTTLIQRAIKDEKLHRLLVCRLSIYS